MTESDGEMSVVTSFTLPSELQTVEECDRYIRICERKKEFMLRMKPAGSSVTSFASWSEGMPGPAPGGAYH